MKLRKSLLGIVALSFFLLLSSNSLADESPTSATRLNETEISNQLQNLPGWTVENRQLRHTYQFRNFVEAINFIDRLVEPAETAGHHPDIVISYNKVTIFLTTHDVGGLTAKDFALAKKIDQIAIPTQLK
jgi:4a-hydroxytetrahydrobiopterin dehydratase